MMASTPHPHSLREQHALMQPHNPYAASSSSSSSFIPGSSKHPSNDIKYLAKYKDLKQKVKDIELDNDRLQLKVLKTKKNIQRLRIERAILYERLSTMPNTELPPQPPQAPIQYPHHPPQVEPQLHNPARRQVDAHEIERRHSQAVFSSPELQAQMEQRRHIDPARPPPGVPPAHPSPPRLHPLPPIEHAPQGYVPMDVDRPPRSRRSIHARESERNAALPVSLPPPPNTLPYIPPHPNVSHSERHGPPDSGYTQYASPPQRDRDRDRDRDRERPHLGGPGLPPIRTRHSDSHSQSSRPNSSSSHGGYAHPLQHPFMSPEDRGWERERERDRDFPPHHMRVDERERERDRRDWHASNGSGGYRDEHMRRYEPDPNPSPGNGHALPDSYTRTRRSSHGQLQAESSSRADRSRWESAPAPDYHYQRPGEDTELAESRRRGYPDMATELLDPTYERHRPAKRGSQDETEDSPHRRRVHRERGPEPDGAAVPRVQEGEAMD